MSVEPAAPVPSLFVGRTDHGLISELARRWPAGGRATIGALLSKLEKAAIAPDDELPPGVARLYAFVELEERPGGRVRSVQLVLPHEVDLGDRRIAVTSPLGAALLGAREGEHIHVDCDGDRRHSVTVLSVRPGHCGRVGGASSPGGLAAGSPEPALTRVGRDPY